MCAHAHVRVQADEDSMLAKLGELYAQLEAVRASRAAAAGGVASAPTKNAHTSSSHSTSSASASATARASSDEARDSVGRLVFVTYSLPYVIVRSSGSTSAYGSAAPDTLNPSTSTSEWVLQEVVDTVDDHAIAAIHGVHQASPDSMWIAAVPLPLEGVDASTLSNFRTQLHAKRIAPVFLDFQKAQVRVVSVACTVACCEAAACEHHLTFPAFCAHVNMNCSCT